MTNPTERKPVRPTESGMLPRILVEPSSEKDHEPAPPPTLPEMEDSTSITGSFKLYNEGEDSAKDNDDSGDTSGIDADTTAQKA